MGSAARPRSPVSGAPIGRGAPAFTGTGRLPRSHVLHRRYHILQPVGQGGMGAVYKAIDVQSTVGLVAIKEMSQNGLAADEVAAAIAAFGREADLLRALRHPGLPHIYDYFGEAGRWYLVMDFIAGDTLEQRVTRGGAGLPLTEALRIGVELCQVLEYLHTRRPPVIFRDLKPANVLLSPDGAVHLIDFGIARLFKPGQGSDTIALGSPGYAAPEQYGKAQTTIRSDLYGLGATLHHLLTGIDPSDTPFSFAPLRARVPQAPAALERLIQRMVQLDARDRPQDAAQVRRELEAIIAQTAGAAAQRGATATPQVGVQRRPTSQAARPARVAAPAPGAVRLSGHGRHLSRAFRAQSGDTRFRISHAGTHPLTLWLCDATATTVTRLADWSGGRRQTRTKTVRIPSDGIYLLDAFTDGDWTVDVQPATAIPNVPASHSAGAYGIPSARRGPDSVSSPWAAFSSRARWSGQASQVTPRCWLASSTLSVHLEHMGSQRFAVYLLDASGHRVELLLCAVGAVHTDRAVRIERAGYYTFEVSADAPWSIGVR